MNRGFSTDVLVMAQKIRTYLEKEQDWLSLESLEKKTRRYTYIADLSFSFVFTDALNYLSLYDNIQKKVEQNKLFFKLIRSTL